jgi:hypothetical protein
MLAELHAHVRKDHESRSGLETVGGVLEDNLQDKADQHADPEPEAEHFAAGVVVEGSQRDVREHQRRFAEHGFEKRRKESAYHSVPVPSGNFQDTSHKSDH